MSTCKAPDNSTQQVLLAASLSEQQARELFRQGEEAVVFALLELTKRLAEAQGKSDPSLTPSTPSGMIPTYKKPPAKRRGNKRPGAKPGHPGSCRQTPERIDYQVEHRAKRCPDRQAVLMSIFRTLKQRSHDPIRTVVDAVEQFITTNQLSPLPEQQTASDG